MDKFVELRKALAAELNIPGSYSSVQGGQAPQVVPVIEPPLRSAPMSVEEPEEATENQPSVAVVAFRCVFTRTAMQLRTDDIGRRWNTIELLKKMLNSIEGLSFDTLAQTGVAFVCAQILEAPGTQLECQAVSQLHLLAAEAEEYALVVVKEGAVGPLTHLLQSRDIALFSAATEILGHLVGYGPSVLSVESSADIVASLVVLHNHLRTPRLVETLAWTLAGFCTSYGELFSQQMTKLCVSAVIDIIILTERDTVGVFVGFGKGAFRTLKHLTCLSQEILGDIVDHVIESNAARRLLHLLNSNKAQLVQDCLQVFGKFVTSSNLRTQYFIDNGLLAYLTNFLQSTDNNIVYYATLTVRNIALPSNSQTGALVYARFVPLLVNVVCTGSLEAVKKATSALGCIANETEDHIMPLFEANAIPAVCHLLRYMDLDADLILITLDTIEKILKTAKKFRHDEHVGVALHNCGGLFGIEKLQRHPNKEFRTKACDVLYTYAFG